MRRLSGAICGLFVLLSLSPAGIVSGADQVMGKKVIDLVNRARMGGSRCGNKYFKATKPVVWNDTLGKASLGHSRDMAEKGFLYHTGTDRKDPGERIARLGYIWSAYGENIAEGYHSPEEVVKGWLKSRDHCENIMNPSFKEAGSGHARGPRGVYWTLLLAAPGKMTSLGP
jgi:uncharacterized protein YkwD